MPKKGRTEPWALAVSAPLEQLLVQSETAVSTSSLENLGFRDFSSRHFVNLNGD
jgi:hypothetical protein